MDSVFGTMDSRLAKPHEDREAAGMHEKLGNSVYRVYHAKRGIDEHARAHLCPGGSRRCNLLLLTAFTRPVEPKACEKHANSSQQ